MNSPLFLVIEPSANARPWFPCEVSWADATHHAESLLIDARGFEPWTLRNTTYYDFHSVLPEALDVFGTKPVEAGRHATGALACTRVYSLRPERDTELLNVLFSDTIGVTRMVTVADVESLLIEALFAKGYRRDESTVILSDLKLTLGPGRLGSQDVHELHALVDLWAATVAVASAPN